MTFLLTRAHQKTSWMLQPFNSGDNITVISWHWHFILVLFGLLAASDRTIWVSGRISTWPAEKEVPTELPESRGKSWAQAFLQKSSWISQQAYTAGCWNTVYTGHPKDWSLRKVVHPNSLPSHGKLTDLPEPQCSELQLKFHAGCPTWQVGKKNERMFQMLPPPCSLLLSSVSCTLAGLRFQHHKTSGKLLKSKTNCVLSSCNVCAYCGLNVVHIRQKPTCG